MWKKVDSAVVHVCYADLQLFEMISYFLEAFNCPHLVAVV